MLIFSRFKKRECFFPSYLGWSVIFLNLKKGVCNYTYIYIYIYNFFFLFGFTVTMWLYQIGPSCHIGLTILKTKVGNFDVVTLFSSSRGLPILCLLLQPLLHFELSFSLKILIISSFSDFSRFQPHAFFLFFMSVLLLFIYLCQMGRSTYYLRYFLDKFYLRTHKFSIRK